MQVRFDVNVVYLINQKSSAYKKIKNKIFISVWSKFIDMKSGVFNSYTEFFLYFFISLCYLQNVTLNTCVK